MTIALVGDLHGNATRGVAAIEYAFSHGADTIIQLGDFGLWPGWKNSLKPGYAFLDRLNTKLAALDMDLQWLDGNHEDHGAIAEWISDYGSEAPIAVPGFSRIHYLPRGYRWTQGGKTFMTIGGAVSVDKQCRRQGLSWWPEEELTDADVINACAGEVDIILAHDCPLGVNIPGIGPDLHHRADSGMSWPYHVLVEAERHRKKCRTIWEHCKPKMWIHGHYHIPYEYGMRHGEGWTRFIGLGDDCGPLKDNVHLLEL